jgi:hypothetical protein
MLQKYKKSNILLLPMAHSPFLSYKDSNERTLFRGTALSSALSASAPKQKATR